MKAEFEYSEEDVREIVLKHHCDKWGYLNNTAIWAATTDYRGVTIRLILEEPKPILKEAIDES
jgi:hypothetical protein